MNSLDIATTEPVVLLQIHGLRVEDDRAPLVFHGSQFRRLAAS
jgi:hypothetical protein